MVRAEMIPMETTTLSFWNKFYELQYKMFFNLQENVQNHMYSSEPIEWPLTGRGIAYWVSNEHNVSEVAKLNREMKNAAWSIIFPFCLHQGQIYLLGNIMIWYSGFVAVLIYVGLMAFYLIRRRRLYYDLDTGKAKLFFLLAVTLIEFFTTALFRLFAVTWDQFQKVGRVLVIGYLLHYLPYFFVDRTLFLYHYLHALVFKCLLTAAVLEHIHVLLR